MVMCVVGGNGEAVEDGQDVGVRRMIHRWWHEWHEGDARHEGDALGTRGTPLARGGRP